MLKTKSISVNSVCFATVFSALIYIGIFYSNLSRHDFDPSYFVRAGANYCDTGTVPGSLSTIVEGDGYDGQFFFRLSINPFTGKRTEQGITLDNPPYRQQRILFPVVVWLLSAGGRPALVPWVMAGVILAALIGLGFLGSVLASSFGRAPAWGLAFSLYPGFIFSLKRDLPEPLAACFLLACLLMVRKERWKPAAVFLTLAVLVRETVLLVALGGLLEMILARRKNARPSHEEWWCWGVPVFAFLSVQAVMYINWGAVPFLSGSGNIGIFLSGFSSRIASVAKAGPGASFADYAELLGIISITSIVFALSVQGRFSKRLQITWLLYFLMVFSLTQAVWVENGAFLRAMAEFHLISFVLILNQDTKKAYIILIYYILLFFAI